MRMEVGMATTSAVLPTSTELAALMEELRVTYLPSKAGKKHLGQYGEAAKSARENFEAALRLEAEGQDLTDFVLLKLLPHTGSEGNVARGAWVSIAPAIKKDIKQWFEGAGWTRAEDWPAVSAAVWRFVRHCVDRREALEEEVARFAEDPVTKGLQMGFLSPILSALRPEWYALVNSKSRKVLNWATGSNFGSKLVNLPELNRAILEFVQAHGELFELPGLGKLEAFDTFCHWMVAIKGFPGKKGQEDPWADYIHWARRFYEEPDFDRDERDYKLEVADRLKEAMAAFKAGADWLPLLRRAFGSPNNLTNWQLNDSFLKWCKADPDGASAVLRAIWDEALPAASRFEEFFARLPKSVASTPGGRICLGSFLHMANDATKFPIYRATPFKVAYRLTGAPHPEKGASEWAVYEHALRFLDRVVEEAKEAELELRDRLDAQGLVWSISRGDKLRPGFFTEEEVAALRQYLGAPPLETHYWKIAPGENAWQWEECRDGGFIALGWDELGDLSDLSEEEFRAHLEELRPAHPDWGAQGPEQAWQFARIGPGDRIVANQGTARVLGIGTVTGPYFFEGGVRHGHRLPVRWDDTAPRVVEQGGWRKTLIELTAEQFEAIAGAASGVMEVREAAGWFGPIAFSLLGELKAAPFKATYLGKRESFQSEVEEPLRALFRSVAARLSPEVIGLLETEDNVQSRFLKNDYGRGGAWPYLWAAAYPKGGRRVDAAQLYMTVSAAGLEAGFSVADNGADARARFLRNLKRHRPILLSELVPQLGPLDLGYGTGVVDGAAPPPGDPRRWLDQVDEDSISVVRRWPAAEVPGVSREALTGQIADLFESLFPLFLLGALDEPLPLLRKYLRVPADELPLRPGRSLEEICQEAGFALQTLEQWVRAIERKKQAVVYGPPGTGKTFLAELLADHLAGGGNGFVELFQFHPSYSYEEFIQGLRPREAGSGGLRFEMVPGRFVEFCRKAAERSGKCVLILDEINRAHLSRVFGELMYLLEYRDKTIPLAGGDRFGIPANVRIIGTMNTADRSIALVDHALRRRFAFLELRPDYGILSRFQAARSFDASGLVSLLQRVNRTIGDPHYEVGISFFLVENLAGQFEHVWRMEIEPYLEEIFFDRRSQLEEFRWDRIRGEVLPK